MKRKVTLALGPASVVTPKRRNAKPLLMQALSPERSNADARQSPKDGRPGREKSVHVHTRSLRYRNKTVKLADGCAYTFLDGDEKGIDVRIALDVIRLAHQNDYNVALRFCRDQDLSEVAEEIRLIARER